MPLYKLPILFSDNTPNVVKIQTVHSIQIDVWYFVVLPITDSQNLIQMNNNKAAGWEKGNLKNNII